MKIIGIIITILLGPLNGFTQETVKVKFNIQAKELKEFKSIGIRGSLSPLSWEKTIPLQPAGQDGSYATELVFSYPLNTILEYKIVYGEKKVVYELEGPNRILVLDKPEIQRNLIWNVRDEIDVNSIPKLEPQQLLADFEILKKTLKEIHPGLYRFRTVGEIDSIFNHYESAFGKPMTYQDAFLNFTRLTSFIQCGHTFPSFYNQNSFIKQIVLNGNDKLPFTFRVIGNQLIVTESVSSEIDLPRGTIIQRINGTSTSDLLQQTIRLVKADGPNDHKRYADLNTFGFGDFEVFDAYFPLLFPPSKGMYNLEVQMKGSDTPKTVVVESISRTERLSRLRKKNPELSKNADALWKLEFWEGNTAYLQLGTFDGFQLGFEWKKFLKDAFEKIRKNSSPRLVIDIRWNEGGQDEILLFIGQNLASQNIGIPKRQDLTRYQKIPPSLKPYLFTWDNSFYDLTNRVKVFDANYYSFAQPTLTEIKSNPNAYIGEVYLLINAFNSSATFYFAEIAKENKLATLIGEKTGGNQQGLNAGTMFFLRLPNSKIEIDIPIVGSFANDKPVGGINPDIEVSETVEDITSGRDAVIEATKKLLRKSK